MGLLLGASTASGFAAPTFVTAMIPLALTFFLFAFFDQVGPGGYLAPKLYGGKPA